MDIKAYLQRINYEGGLEPKLETLSKLHRAHLLAIPYENFDIHLGRRLELGEQHFYNKLVLQKRGGWCYEMNGLFAWVLRELGFEVQLLAGAVRSSTENVNEVGNHLVLLVQLEQPYLADVGLGDGFLEPLPLVSGEYTQNNLTFRLEQKGKYWVLHNHALGAAKKYDFTLEPRELTFFAKKCHELQTSLTSGFTRVTNCQFFTPDSILTLKGAVLKVINQNGASQHIIESQTEYQEVLQTRFRLNEPEIFDLWPRVWERHQEWLKQEAAKATNVN